MTKIYNQQQVKSYRRELRKSMTKPEQLLWYRLRNKQLKGHKFRRQYSIGRYVADFYCPKLKLVIEIDGDSHFVSVDAIKYDSDRSLFFNRLGIRVLRFTNTEIISNIEGVMGLLFNILPDLPQPLLSKEGGKISSLVSRGDKKAFECNLQYSHRNI